MTKIYDSRAFVKRLVENGMPEAEADTLASENLLLISEHLATKDDLKYAIAGLQAEMHAGFSKVDTEFAKVRVEMAAMENRLLLKLGGLMAGLLTLFNFL